MYIPDNYDRFILEERRLDNSKCVCRMCGDWFTDDEMSDDYCYCEDCYIELEEEQENEV